MSGNGNAEAWPSGLVIVDKSGGMTSHDVVARIRRLAHTRRVGHAGTLDPMATGVLVIGIEKATRLLGHLTLTEKTYEATIRLGQSTSTDDAEGEPTGGSPASGIIREAIEEEIAKLTGEILQVPSSVSAIKVNGQRAYKLTRAGEAPELAARPVRIYEFRVTAIRQEGDFLDIDAIVRCSSGTYIRALARDLGTALGVGGHLTALRRTAVGPYTLAQAHTLNELENQNQSAERLRLTPTPHPPFPAAEASVVPQAQPARPAPDPRAAPAATPESGDPSSSPPQEPANSPVLPSTALPPTGSLAPLSLRANNPSARTPGKQDDGLLGLGADNASAGTRGKQDDGSAGSPGYSRTSPLGASAGVNGPSEPQVVPPVTPLAEAAAAAFPRLDLTADDARRLAQGARLSLPPNPQLPNPSASEVPLAAFDPDGALVALVSAEGGQIRSLAVFARSAPTSPDA